MSETWKSVEHPRYAMLYKVSDLGRIGNCKTGKILKGYQNTTGKSLRVTFHDRGGSSIFSVAILVWEAFEGRIPNGYGFHFADGDRKNCARTNLSLTKSENLAVNRGARAVQLAYKEKLSVKETWQNIFAEIAPETTKIIEQTRRMWA